MPFKRFFTQRRLLMVVRETSNHHQKLVTQYRDLQKKEQYEKASQLIWGQASAACVKRNLAKRKLIEFLEQ